FKSLEDIVPRPGHKATGEERAWGRRLAKRFGAEGRIDDRTFVLNGDGNRPCVLDHEAVKPDSIDKDIAAFEGLEDIVPRPGHKATGEERAWGRRLAKRFGCEGRVDDRSFLVQGTGDTPPALDHECIDRSMLDPAVTAFFDNLDRSRGDALIGFGWAMAEYLAARAGK
ncbi:MAG: hypothetical protein M3326_03090, partial [Actinomycetota bacterium]|nr:hypothetical protein [Actinomycetota bacterium]